MIINNQYTILTIAVGISLVLMTVISYLVVWHPRVSKKHWVNEESKWRDVFGSIPWILVITYVGIAFMTVFVTIYYSFNRANW
jgi:hypothetical protein